MASPTLYQLTPQRSFQGDLQSLNQATSESIRLDAQRDMNTKILRVRAHMKDSEQKQAQEDKEIEDLVNKVFKEELLSELSKLVKSNLLEQLDALVDKEVQAKLPEYLAQNHLDTIRTQMSEFQRLEQENGNAESISWNGALPLDRAATVRPLVNSKGEVSPRFPRTLGEFFDLTEDTVVGLLHYYGHEDVIAPHGSREKNVNAFMRICGIRYMVRRRSCP
ncbi:hypothetical protein C2E23DRAFT_721306 [Lenzites betulinus]|nr:hypothetical protein C2E23DRAFT_721306 [Lenzites betulinus]